MNLGILIISITLLGYISNWLNWRYLNSSITVFLFYVGAFIHEFSHVIFCRLTGAEIIRGSIFSKNPHIIHFKPKMPFLGQFLISLAPIIGGLAFLFLINKYLLADYFKILEINTLKDFFFVPLSFLSQIKVTDWEGWLALVLFLNAGAMLGPSFKDLKNIWPAIIICFFIKWPPLLGVVSLAVAFIIINILIQLVLISFSKGLFFLRKRLL